MFLIIYLLPALYPTLASGLSASIDIGWHAPNVTWINDLHAVINGTGTHGFVFNSSQLPEGVPYGTYNWCNMPHVRKEGYQVPGREFKLEYVELIHRHHKRTPYAANTFPRESYSWDCSDEALFYYGAPLNPRTNASALTYWSVYTSPINPFAPKGFKGTCQFPQITHGGLDDSWQHGRDLYGVYHDLLQFIPDEPGSQVSYRATNNVITSQVAGMVVDAMYRPSLATQFPLLIQPASVDSLEPAYSCPAASNLYKSYSVGSSTQEWTAHLNASRSLYATLDAISGVPSNDKGFHMSWDHYFDNLSARQCHGKLLPCQIGRTSTCVLQAWANEVYRLGQYEYSYLYRDAPQSLEAAVGSYGVWIAELAQNIRDRIAGVNPVIYRHNIAHDGSISRLLSILQVDVMVWPGMGAEVVFEVYSKRGTTSHFVRVLWGGQVLRSSNPSLGLMDMLDVEVLLAYFDRLAGVRASKMPSICNT